MPTQTEGPDVVLIGAGISITRTRSSYHARCARRFLAHGSSYWPTGFHASEAYPVTAGVAAVQPRDILPRGGTSAAISRSYGCRISRGLTIRREWRACSASPAGIIRGESEFISSTPTMAMSSKHGRRVSRLARTW